MSRVALVEFTWTVGFPDLTRPTQEQYVDRTSVFLPRPPGKSSIESPREVSF